MALVTGASRGIGRAIAETLAGAGYDLVLTCSRTLPELSGLANSLEEKYGIHCTAQMADASDQMCIRDRFVPADRLSNLLPFARVNSIPPLGRDVYKRQVIDSLRNLKEN